MSLPSCSRQHSPCRPPPSVATTCIWYSGVVSLSRQQTDVRTRPVSGCSEKMGSPVRSCITFFCIEYVTFAFVPSEVSSASHAATTATDRSMGGKEGEEGVIIGDPRLMVGEHVGRVRVLGLEVKNS